MKSKEFLFQLRFLCKLHILNKIQVISHWLYWFVVSKINGKWEGKFNSWNLQSNQLFELIVFALQVNVNYTRTMLNFCLLGEHS